MTEGKVFTLADRLVRDLPSPQTALDIFKGEWISKLPGGDYQAGVAEAFNANRLPSADPVLGPIEDKRVLDLGSLEGGHAYILEQMGAQSVVGVEANSIMFLRSLIVKEILDMKHTRFLCGDALEYLRHTQDQFDVCIASGFLYHMVDPVELLSLIAQKTGRLFIWTHYFDEDTPARNVLTTFNGTLMKEFKGEKFLYHTQHYGDVFATSTFSGGTSLHSNWISKASILRALAAVGFKNVNVLEDIDTAHGPVVVLTANQF
jgi:SAM-dependent methyltransferase